MADKPGPLEVVNKNNVSKLGSKEDFPIVFYCSECNSILGDSLSWVDSNEALQILILSHVTKKVKIGEELLTSFQDEDLGSTFVQLFCSQCDAILGKMYKTTPRRLDHMRDLYSISVGFVESYQLGGADQSSPADQLLTVPDGKAIHYKLNDMQRVILGMHSRIVALEEAANISPNHGQDIENQLQ